MKRKNLFIKLASLALAIVCCVPMTACGGGKPGNSGTSNDKEVNPNLVQVHIANYDGATGSKWLSDLIIEYEKTHDVQIWIDNKKDEFAMDKLIPSLKYGTEDTHDMFFLCHADYQQMYAQGVLEDLTTTVTTKIYNDDGDFPASGETATKSIIDMMYPELDAVYNLGAGGQDSYYALPFFYATGGIIYDADLFDEKNLYFDIDGEIGVKSNSPDIGPGPDGDINTTADNGEPETFEQFKVLIDAIRSASCTPFTWSGKYYYQRQSLKNMLWANYEGKNDAMLAVTFNGTDSTLGAITPETGWKITEQYGHFAAFSALEYIEGNPANYSEDAFKEGIQSHTVAQEEYLDSIRTPGGRKRIAMLLENTYWETEARGVFDDMEEIRSSYGYGKRNFKLLSPFKFIGTNGITDQTSNRTTYYGTCGGNIVGINSYSSDAVKTAAKEFLQYVQSRQGLAKFTVAGSALRPYTYTVNTEEMASATPFMRNVIEKRLLTDCDLVLNDAISTLAKENKLNYYMNTAELNSTEYIEAMSAFNDSRTWGTRVTAQSYWEAVQLATRTQWENLFN